MRIGRPRFTLDAVLYVSSTFAVLVIARALSLAIPSEFYFTFQALFSDRPPQDLVLALFGKMLAPAIVGFACGWLLHRSARQSGWRNRTARMARRLRQLWASSVFLGAFTAAFLSAWPMIVYWDLLANPEVAHLKAVFFVLYLLYMFAFGYVALLGLLGAVFVCEHLESDADSEAQKMVSAAELSRVGALWLVNSGIASTVLSMMTR